MALKLVATILAGIIGLILLGLAFVLGFFFFGGLVWVFTGIGIMPLISGIVGGLVTCWLAIAVDRDVDKLLAKWFSKL